MAIPFPPVASPEYLDSVIVALTVVGLLLFVLVDGLEFEVTPREQSAEESPRSKS